MHRVASNRSQFNRALEDRRANPRVAAIFDVDLFDGSVSLSARAMDIGLGGLCVRTQAVRDTSRVFSVKFRLGMIDVCTAVSTRWISSNSNTGDSLIGLAFEALEPPVEVAIWHFVQERARALASFLLECDGLSSLSLYDALQIGLKTTFREVNAGEIFIDGGLSPHCRSVFVVYRGTVAVEDASSEYQQPFAILGPNALFGRTPVDVSFAPIERAVAANRSRVLVLASRNLDDLASSRPHVASTLFRALKHHYMKRVANLIRSLEKNLQGARS